MTLAQFTEPKLLIPRLLSLQQDGAIEELTRRLETTRRLKNPGVFLPAILKREHDFPTFIGEGVAVPHVRNEAVEDISLAVGLSQAGILWGLGQNSIARLIFLFALPLDEPGTYLKLLSLLSRLIAHKPEFTALAAATQPEQMLASLNAVHLPR
jgi:PTS system fructose-specific IIC component